MTESTATRTDVFSIPEIRIEGREKVTGALQYTADIHRPNELWAAYAISPHPHARILRVDTAAARAVDGVRAVLTGADIGPRRLGRNLFDWPVLAYEVVRFVGERVVAVAAETREAAERAAALIEVEYEELPAVFEPRDALAADAPVLHPDRDRYFYRAFAGKEPPKRAHPNIQGGTRFRKGAEDLGPVFAGAFRVFEQSFTTPRQHAGYIEPRSTVVWIDPDDTVHVITPNKQPYNVRDQMAQVTGLPKNKIVVEPSAIGGDFGGKGLTIDEFSCYFLAKATGRPIRFVDTYTDELRTGTTRHRMNVTLKTAVDADGNFIAHESTVVFNGGAYAGGKPSPQLVPSNGYALVPYRIPNVKVDTTSVYTNTLPTAHVRAPVASQLYFAWEQHVDTIAEALGIDPLEFRLRNCVRQGDTFPTNEKIRDANATLVLETLKRESKWGAPVRAGHGRGLALVAWHLGSGKASVKMRLAADGTVEIVTGMPEQGGGAHTIAQRIAAAALDIAPEHVSVRRGTTAEAPDDPGAGASRVTHILGGAAEEAAKLLREQLAERTGATWRDERFVDAGGKPVTLAQLASQACAQGPIEVTGVYDGTHDAAHPADFTFIGLCVDVDADAQTGAFTITDALVVTDVGKVINPIAHQGQIDGGFVFGLGNALMEELPLDENGQVTTLSLGEYKLPTMRDIPPLRTVLVQAPLGEGPYGAKAAGELGNIGVPAAIMNGVANALGIRLAEYPITAERVYQELALEGKALA